MAMNDQPLMQMFHTMRVAELLGYVAIRHSRLIVVTLLVLNESGSIHGDLLPLLDIFRTRLTL